MSVRTLTWCLVTFGLTAAFGRVAAYNLGNYRPVTNDEVELIAVGYKLATLGVFGSDMYAGFFGADQHYLWTPPLQHVLDAATFRLAGAGLTQARAVSVVAAVGLVWLVGGLAYRWYGLGVAIACEVLLIGWRSGLTGAPAGLPLLGVARAARYDVLAVALAWIVVWALQAGVQRPSRARALVAGGCAGLAALAQFFGVTAIALAGLGWMAVVPQQVRRRVAWVAIGAAAVVLPWAAFVGANASDFRSQLLVYGARGDFLHPEFYVTNITTEAARYAGLPLVAEDAPAWFSAALLVAVWPALVRLGWRAIRRPGPGDRLLALTLLIPGAFLLVLDATKTPLYAIVLVPSICVALAAAGASLGRAMMRWPVLGRSAAVLGSVVLAMVVLDGARAYQADLAQARAAHPYLEVGRELDAATEPGGMVLGPERWWWAMRGHPYVSLRSIWFQWVARAADQTEPPRFAAWVAALKPTNIIVNDNVRDDLRDFPAPLQAQFGVFLEQCAEPITTVDDATYLDIVIFRVYEPPPGACTAQGVTPL